MPNFLTYGQSKGLAYQHDWKGEIEGLYQREAYATQQEEMTQQKARYYGELLKKPSNVRTEYNSRRLDSFYKDKMGEIGDFVINNPDFEKDIGLMAKFNQLADSIMNNPIVQEELQVEEEFNLLKANRDKLTDKKYFLEAERYSNYINQDPDTPESERIEPYFFNKFLVVDPTDIINKAASDVATTYMKTIVDGQQIYAERFDPQSLDEIAFNYYMVEENKNALDSHFNKLDDNIRQLYDNLTYKWFKTQISAREDKRFLYSMLQKEGAKDATFDTISPAYRDIYRHLLTGSIPRATNPGNIAFTPFAETGTTKSLRELEDTGGALISKDDDLVPLGVNAQYRSIAGGGQIIEQDGKWYTSVMVQASLSHSESQKEAEYGVIVDQQTGKPLESQSMKLGEALAKAGFQSMAEVTGGIMDGSFLTGGRRANVLYQGEIFVPMDFNEMTTDRYNKAMAIGGQKQLEGIDRSLDIQGVSYGRFINWLSTHDRKPLKGITDYFPKEIDDDGVKKWGIVGRKDGRPYLITEVGGQPTTKQLTNQEYLEYKSGR